MSSSPEEPAKNYQISALKDAMATADSQLKDTGRRVDDIIKNQVTTPQLEDRIKALTSSYEDKIKSLKQQFDSDIREVHLKYGPLADNYKWLTRGIITLVFAQLIALAFNLLGSKS